MRYFLSLSPLLHRRNRRTLSRQQVFAFANGRKYLCTASRAVQPLDNATPRPGSEQPRAGTRCLLNDKRKDISEPRRIFTFFSGVFQVKSKELKKINNSNKKEARKRCPKSGKSENEKRKEKEALSMGQGVGKGGEEAWEEGRGTTKENKMCHAKWFWGAHLSSCFYFRARA